ncbi:phosphatidylinositol-4-phosphate 5-kinase fab1 (PtdIns(4)P-5-kinase) [Pyrenophora tritici-repentis Pt-1C-BFP]|uniref:Phosphatidylinositol-4-phosphate 5-kinase fab1 (PtdIns(4)P-5-kinase) n=1 Tax=Pyrenophora tritici-repentis (strain Pt-1C-BFP) TaxID=426418 RepID=B2WAV1_PYRTR|nr:phosphatidylinositol-4-phosphate 5-kinase fab1 (PtdIns(4)P-5-kinase) [Pyrenophora tritici-repentis Pt-1C-BFP]EDU50333.1 phosphatidylinositol-4-phosphate 5-kinase fab1 (PtdIns(4)P-5-kinase) [Pyrenophora tritici-repentis Pt-1C-BFP]
MARDSRRGSLQPSLHQMHAVASRSDTLTTFDDFTVPPAPSVVGEPKGIELVQGGFSGLYSRLRASVGGGSREQAQDGSGNGVSRTGTPPAAGNRNSPGGTSTSSPQLVALPPSRLQSPATATFPETLPPSRDSNISSTTFSSKASRSRPSISASIEPGPAKQDEVYIKSPVSIHSKNHSTSTIDLPRSNTPRDSALGSQKVDSPRFSRENAAPRQQGDFDLVGQESDDTDDDDDLGGAIGQASTGDSKTGSDTPRESLSRVSSRTDSQYQPNRSVPNRELPENSAEGTQPNRVAVNQSTTHAPEPQRPPLVHVGPSHLPGFRPSRASSSDGLSSVVTASTIRMPTVPPIEEIQRQVQAAPAANTMSRSTFTQMRRKILDREFWMRDENAKACFNCGDAFTTFRRKHHCRTCGQIFDSKCTSIVSGKMFGQQSNLKVCKPCEGIIYGHDDDSSDYTDDGDQGSIYDPGDTAQYSDQEEADHVESDHTKIGTPTISIPMSRKIGNEKKRRPHVIEVGPQTLARPSSSRSLRSLGGRPRSSSHKRHPSKHQHMRNVKHDDRAPFHQYHDNSRSQPSLSAFHHDNIIDPDLAPFMSDDGSSEEEHPSIFATLKDDPTATANLESERGGLGGLLAAMRKGKSRPGDRSVFGTSHARDADNVSIASRNGNRPSRRRNLSVSSMTHRASPRRSKSNSLLRPYTGYGASGPGTPQLQPSPSPTPSGSRITRSASMQGMTPKVELNKASLDHARKLLIQMLHDAGVSHASNWERALIPILRQCTDDVNPDVDRGDDIDVRNYIKLKKIPGGKPKDTAYVSGVVFTKNVALRSMPRSIPNPRIVIITFAIEYARHQAHFMSLEPVIAQEREYLRNLVSRIAALEPHVLLVQRNVAGLALEFLEKEGIAVVYNVKPTVLNAVARCTNSKMISSVDKLATDPSHLGSCGSFDVKTYVHKNARKTYIFLSGCQKELGCTIVLRGAESQELVKLKRVTEFMTYVVYNLRLETCLMRDEFIDTPTTSIIGTLASSQNEQDAAQPQNTADAVQRTADGDDTQTNDAAPSYYSDMVENHRTKILSSSPFVKFMQPYLLEQARQYEAKLGHLKKLKNQYTADDQEDEKPGEVGQKFELVQPEMVHTVVEKASKQVREFLSAVHASEYDKAMHQYMTQKRQWEQYLSGNTDLYDPFNHQKIAVLYSVVNTTTSTPCIGPEIIALGFYQEHDYDDGFTPDCTLGQYVEDLCTSAGVACEVGNCDRRMLDHSRQYVHGEGQMTVIVQKHPPKLKGMYQTILMWSCCRVCGQETQTFPMSEWSWRYSFAKYLELTFWSTKLHPRAGICPHDIHKDHVRYFGYNNVALRIQYDPVPMYEVIAPKPNVTWKVDSDLRLKNSQYLMIEEKLDCFMNSLRARIQGIHVEDVIPEKVDLCRKEVDILLKRTNEEHEWLKAKLQDKYMSSKYYEIIPMNRAIRAIQEKAIAWDVTFMEFEQQFFPSERDIRRYANMQLKRFLERDESTSSLASVDEGTESGADDSYLDEKDDSIALSPRPSNMSPEMARDMLSSVVKEESSASDQPADGSTTSPEHKTPTSPRFSSELPIQTPREALERDDIRHLDLAIPSNFPDSPTVTTEDSETPTGASDPNKFDEGSPTPTSYPKVNPIDKSLAEAIENMPTSPSTLQSGPNPNVESKIPRLVDNARREPVQRPATLVRTQSQPGNIAKHISPSVFNSGPAALKPNTGDTSRAFERMTERLGLGLSTPKQSKNSSRIPRSIPYKSPNKVSKIAQHFEQLSREFQNQRMRERRNDRARQVRAFPLASSKPVVEVYKNVHDAVQENEDSDEDLPGGSPTHESLDHSMLDDSTLTEQTDDMTIASQSPVEERQTKDLTAELPCSDQSPEIPSQFQPDNDNDISDADITPEDIPLPDSLASSQLLNLSDSQLENSLELPKHEKNTLLKILTSFWSERSASGWTPLEYPFSQIEHVWENSDIIIREDEPSSIIALALSCPDYVAKRHSFREDNSASGHLETFEESIERNLLHEENHNIRYSFTNRGVKAHCKIFYAQSFDALRRKCGVAERFVESLSRCSKWDSKGGKSKSIFLKTLDDRFVLKSLSPVEVQAFFKFGPNYFAFTHQNLFKSLPSVIAKMFGLFQVQIKTPTGRDFDWYMLVMENLFYDREPNRRYDLKGSMRNRKIQATGERDEVLLDENLVDIIYSETPIFVREHTKKLLKASVFNDTLFLSQNNVMDYSLMAGFDDTNREIIVGIIDCIRTYTWDKKLESWIKDRGKNKPTITSPRDYRNRFRIAMEKYILQAPNCWHQFSGRMTNISSVGGGSSFASTSKIVSQLDDGTQKAFFMKTGSGKEAEVMFEGRSGSKSGKAQSLAAKLAKLHTTPAPNPEGYDKPMFGFPATTCCGDTPQDNSYKESWADFYAENRLRFIVRYAEQRGRRDGEVRKLVERTASEVVPRLIGDAHLNNGKGVTPVVVHGDLWSGNASVGVIGSDKGEPEDVVYDSSACYAHSEFELGIMKMFGGFGGSFLKEYHEICPKTEPVEEYADRVKLYELYHHLNHYAMFGGSYRSGAVGIMNNLIRKYGGDG